MATITELINDASEIRDAELEQENTAFKVGTMLVNIIEHIGGMSDNVTEQFSMYFANGHLKEDVLPSAFVSSLSTAIEACATHDSDNLLDLLYSRIILLDSMGSELDGVNYTPSAGDLVWRNNYVFRWDGSDWGNGIPPRKHVVYINKHTRKLYMHTGSAMVEIGNGYAEKIQISKMDQSSVDNIPVGKLHFVVGRNKLVYRISANEVCEWTPSTKLIYIDVSNNTIYRWQGSVWVALSSGSGEFVNDLTTGGVDKGLTAEQGKVLKGKIDEVQANIVNLYKRLANIAFPTAADKAAAKPTELDWNIPKVTVTITNSIGSGIAVIKRNGQAVSGSVMLDQGDSLTLTIEGADGYGLTAVSAAIDGGTATPLTGVNGVFTLNVAQVNAAMSIVITGTYSQTVGITYNLTNCRKTAGPTSVVTGGGATIEITADDGYTLDSVTPTVTGATIDSWTLNAGVGTLVIINVTGAVVVSAEATQAGQIPVTKTIGRGEGTITGNDSVAAGSTYSCAIAPSSYWGLKAANVKVLIDGVEAAASDYTLTIDASYNGSLSVPTPASIQSLEIVVEFAVKLYSGNFISTSGAYAQPNIQTGYTPCAPQAFIPLPDTFVPGPGDVYNWRYEFAANINFTSGNPAHMVFYSGKVAANRTTYWGATSATSRTGTMTNTVLNSKYFRAAFNVNKITDCFLKYTPSGKSEITLFDGSDTDSYIIV